MARYLVGIDLGTTNSALSWVDTLDRLKKINNLEIEQFEDHKLRVFSKVVPSFLYIPTKKQKKDASSEGWLNLESDSKSPWVGVYAKQRQYTDSDRVVASAKSWLCHNGVDRNHKILPWGSSAVVSAEKVSPVEALTAYIIVLKEAWNSQKAHIDPDFRLELQDVTLTVPASFDEVASRLTLQAASLAGLEKVRLIEEPQAAFYEWMYRDGVDEAPHKLTHFLNERDQAILLICDIGGGTSDLSLLRLHKGGDVERIAVSEHILLGGDNIDQSLAHHYEKEFVDAGFNLQGQVWASFIAQCRRLKEQALSGNDHELKLSLSNQKSKLFGNTKTISIDRKELCEFVLEGFFPECNKDFRFEKSYRAGLQEWGLPYAADPGISRHIAHFLDGRSIDGVLYTGGTLKPDLLQKHLTKQMESWQESKILEFDVADMDLAVSRGAAWHGASAMGLCGQIRSGYARTLYVEVQRKDASKAALCLVPRGAKTGSEFSVEIPGLQVRLGEPIRFRLLSSLEPIHQLGDLLDVTYDMSPLAPLETLLKHPSGKKGLVPAYLKVHVMDTGLLKVACVHEEISWDLEFVTRAHFEWQEHQNTAELKDLQPQHLNQAIARIDECFGKAKKDTFLLNPQRLIREMESLFEKPRSQWNAYVLRKLWEPLARGMTRRFRSEKHEHAWLQLVGFTLRPGFGVEFDEFRIAQAMTVLSAGVQNKTPQVLDQWWIFWRRLAGGLTRDQQNKIFDKSYPLFLKKSETSELIRCLGAFERMDIDRKKKLGSKLVQDLQKESYRYAEAALWSLARLGSRSLLYASQENVVPPAVVVAWWPELQLSGVGDRCPQEFLFFLSCIVRKVESRYFDLPLVEQKNILNYMKLKNAHPDQMSRAMGLLQHSKAEQFVQFGEELPSGLFL